MSVDLETYWNEIREKKFLMETNHRFWAAHHPSRLSKIAVTGGYSLTVDERLQYTAPIPNGTTAQLSVTNVSVGSALELIRLWDKEPLGLYRSRGESDQYFYLQHQPGKPWRIMPIDIEPGILAVVGTFTNTFYTWNSTSSTWVESGSTSGNVNSAFSMLVLGGGNEITGGYEPGNTDAQSSFAFALEIGGVVYAGEGIKRYPWDNPMAPDNGFQQAFQDFVDGINAGSSATIATGACDISINFVFPV